MPIGAKENGRGVASDGQAAGHLVTPQWEGLSIELRRVSVFPVGDHQALDPRRPQNRQSGLILQPYWHSPRVAGHGGLQRQSRVLLERGLPPGRRRLPIQERETPPGRRESRRDFAKLLITERDDRAIVGDSKVVPIVPIIRDRGRPEELALARGLQRAPGGVTGAEKNPAPGQWTQIHNGVQRRHAVPRLPSARLGPAADGAPVAVASPHSPGGEGRPVIRPRDR